MASRFDKASEHLMTEVDEKACLTPDGQEVEAVKATLVEVDYFLHFPCDLFINNLMLNFFFDASYRSGCYLWLESPSQG